MAQRSNLARTFVDLSDEATDGRDPSWVISRIAYVKAMGWDELLTSLRVLIISEAGVGKTEECKAQRDRLWDLHQPAFYLDLATLATQDFVTLLSDDELRRFEAWLHAQSDVATFFLDSIDELNLTKASFEQALRRMSHALAGNGARARIIITSRPTEFDRTAFKRWLDVVDADEPQDAQDPPGSMAHIAALIMGDPDAEPATEEPTSARVWRNVTMTPLSDIQIKQFAEDRGIENADVFIEALRKLNALEFARRPQDLVELCANWLSRGRIGNHREQVAENIVIKLKRRTSRKDAPLSGMKALEGARALALTALLTRRLTFRHTEESDSEGMIDSVIDPAHVLTEWDPDDVVALLARPLFGHATYGRVRFHHQSVIEYLAAEQLRELFRAGLPTSSLLDLMFATTPDGLSVVKPSMRATTAWLAADVSLVFQELLKREPEVLLIYGDPASLPPRDRSRAIRTYVEASGASGWRGITIPTQQIHRIASPELTGDLIKLWNAGVQNPEVREFLLQLFAAAPFNAGTDAAYSTAMDTTASDLERCYSAEVLLACDDVRLPALAESMASDGARWSASAASSVALRLIPDRISPDQICDIFDRTTPKKSQTSNPLAWSLGYLVSTRGVSHEYRQALLRGLPARVGAGVTWSKNEWPRVRTARFDLVPLLADLCDAELEAGYLSVDLLCASVLAAQLSARDYQIDKPANRIRGHAARWSSANRKTAFFVTDALFQAIHPEGSPSHRLRADGLEGLIQLDPSLDTDWVFEVLGDPSASNDVRHLMLEAVFTRLVSSKTSWARMMGRAKRAVGGQADLLASIKRRAALPAQDPDLARLLQADRRQRHKHEKADHKILESWLKFWTRVTKAPAVAFDTQRAKDTTWHWWRWISQFHGSELRTGWNRRFMERHFGKDTADRMRLALMEVWRNERPTLPSERPASERNNVLMAWGLGSAAITAEAEDSSWARALTPPEADLAARYAVVDWNGFPGWLESLTAAQPAAVLRVLGPELSAELTETVATSQHASIQQHLSHAADAVKDLLLPTVVAWFEQHGPNLGTSNESNKSAYLLDSLVELLLARGGLAALALVKRVAVTALNASKQESWTKAWIITLFRVDPPTAVTYFDRHAHQAKSDALAIRWLAEMFGERHHSNGLNPRSTLFTPAVLLHLTRLAYTYVDPSHDIVHEGSYSPNERDHAQQARSTLLVALLQSDGPGAWAAKLAIVKDPIIGTYRDRALTLATQNAAEAAEGPALAMIQVNALLKATAIPPTTRDQMFDLLRHRLDDLDNEMRSDTSPREMWAKEHEERLLRRAIARELERMAKGAYIVDQESITSEEKEMDIRLISTASDESAVIELKVGDDRPGRDLRDTIHAQLVTKYMAPSGRKSGCLLVTVSKHRRWEHPDTKLLIDVEGLRDMLSKEALRIERSLEGAVRVEARVLDLSPPLPLERERY